MTLAADGNQFMGSHVGRSGTDSVVLVPNAGVLHHFSILEQKKLDTNLLQFLHAQSIASAKHCLAVELFRGGPLDVKAFSAKKALQALVVNIYKGKGSESDPAHCKR